MTCYHPLKAYRSRETNPKTGKRQITFNRPQGYADLPLELPCGQCIGCRLERSRQWAIRCIHEAARHEENSFITLTYDDDHLPEDRSLNVRHFQLFMKKLRKNNDHKIRFYHCGEYGDTTDRPHYHAILFGHDFEDKILWKNNNDNPLYISDSLTETWGKGFCTIGDVTFQSAAYVARYVMKKINGDHAQDHYQYINEYGEVFDRKPEYTTMSRRPGIGHGWFSKYQGEVYPRDEVIVNAHPVRPPKYYDRILENENPKAYRKVRGKRVQKAKEHSHDQTPERLKVREKVQNARLQLLPRKVE